MIITVGGIPGAGKSTVTKLLAQKTGYEIINIGAIKRELAQEMGISIFEFDQLGHTNPDLQHKFDLQYEEYQQSLDLDSKIILESRLGYYNQPHAFKVFLSVDGHVAAQRIYDAQRQDDANESLEHVYETNQQRRENTCEAYRTLYQTEMNDMTNYDLVVDTTHKSPEEVTEILYTSFISFLETQGKNI